MKIDGACHCGSITYEAEIDPAEVYLCHCTDCQAISGSPFRWAVPVPEAAFRLLAGSPRTYVKTTARGTQSHQLFCPDCASPIYSRSVGAEPRMVNLRLGTARQRDALRPRAQYWCRSAQSWAVVADPTGRQETE
jgi:hypothetical protein